MRFIPPPQIKQAHYTILKSSLQLNSSQDQRPALDALPQIPGTANPKEAETAIVLKTGTDNQYIGAYKPAYKKTPAAELTPDLAGIVDAWLELPEYIKAAIKALIRTQDPASIPRTPPLL